MRLQSAKLLICLIIIILIFSGQTYLKTITFNKQKQNSTISHFTIIFKEIPKIDGNKLSGLVYDTKLKRTFWLQYNIKNAQEKKFLNHTIFTARVFKITGNLTTPTKNTIENGFNFLQYLKNQQTYYILQAETFTTTNIRKTFGHFWSLRERGIQFLKLKLPKPLQYYTSALIFGESKSIPQEEYRNYQKIGVVHLFAISGAHVGILVNSLYYTLTRAGLIRQYARILILIILPIYVIIAGGAPSIIRASGIYVIHHLAKLFNKNISSLQAIGVTLFISLLYNPAQILSIGWQLTYTIALSISLSHTILQRYTGYSKKILVLTIICQLASLPIILIHFYEFSLAGFIFNIIYIPIFTYLLFPTVIFSYLSILLPFLPSSFLIFITNKLFIILSYVSYIIAKIPFMNLIIGKPNYIMMLLLILITFFLMVTWEINKINMRLLATNILILWIVIIYNQNYLSSTGEVNFLDVGQGDAILIKLPHNGGNYLIDTGGVVSFTKETWQTKTNKFDTGKDIILPYLKSKGIRKIDKLILTHADQDHIGGAIEIINSNELQIKEIVIPKGQINNFNEKINLTSVAENQKISEVSSGEQWKIGNNYFYILHPAPTENNVTDLNYGSIVLYALINNKKWIFTGDLDQAGEVELLRRFPNINADVLKVGHHGSKTSSSEDFLQTIKPKIAIISSGKNNRYGHPNEEVLERLENLRIKTIRTDQMGSINYIFKNKKGSSWRSYPP